MGRRIPDSSITGSRALKEDAEQLVKTLKEDMKGMVSVVIVAGGSRWEQDEHGQWAEVPNEDAPSD